MATKNDYPSYLPDDFRGLDSIQEGNQRYYYSHLVIRFPEGSTIDVVPPNSVGTEQLIDGGVKHEDLDPEIEASDGDIDSIFNKQKVKAI